MSGERFEGALTTLVRVGPERVKDVHQRFADARFYTAAGRHKQPAIDELKEDLSDGLYLFEVCHEGDDQAIGYAGIVTYSGPPYVFFELFEAKVDVDMAQDAILQLVHAFFRQSEEEELWVYLPRPVNEDVVERLSEGGFDAWDDELPGVDTKKVAPYMLARHTYVAYYGDEVEGSAGGDDDERDVGEEDE